MAKIKTTGVNLDSPESKKYIADFLEVLPTLPPEEQEAVRKIMYKYRNKSDFDRKWKLLNLARSYLASGILPTASWDFEEMV